MKIIGKWWNDKNIDLLEFEGTIYALHGWNGESFTECWECLDEFNFRNDESYTIKPIIGEYLEDEENNCFTSDVIDYEITKN